MALAAVHTAMHLEESKNVHPFFSKSSKAQASEPATNDATANHDGPDNDQDYGTSNTSPQAAKRHKKRTKRTAHVKNQPSLDNFTHRPAVESNDAGTEANAAELAVSSLEGDLNLDRRKRRKTSSPEPSTGALPAGRMTKGLASDPCQQSNTEAYSVETQDVIDGLIAGDTLVASTSKNESPESSIPQFVTEAQEDAGPEFSLPQAAQIGSQYVTLPNASQYAVEIGNDNTAAEVADGKTAKTTTKKQIKVTKSGKLVSSPPKSALPMKTTPKRRGRPRKAIKNNNLSSTITIIKYGSDTASRSTIGQKIEAILSEGRPSNKRTVTVQTKLAGPPKAPHPFFTGKAGHQKVEVPAKPDVERQSITPRKSACTPGKLRAERRKELDDESSLSFGVLSKNSRLAKQSGLNEPLWPSKETVHVRNLSENESRSCLESPTANLILKPAKLKKNVYTLSAEEEVVTRLANQLSKDLHTRTNPTGLDFAPPEDVRLPTRLLTTGIEIQNRVRAQIEAPLETLAQRHYAKTHPAITTLFDAIEHVLTPFDQGRCEPQAWVQKYRPGRADHVLQSGREAFALKDWLQNSTVMAVGATQDPLKTSVPPDTKKPPKKKRKTAADDFIVSDDDEEEEEMVELPQTDSAVPRPHPSLTRRRWTRNKNVVLLSGPHGCGKSATVYAVAKELDFEIFELHSGVRRSGKDIQDKVGDMTANHLVNHQRGDVPAKVKPTPTIADNDTDNERDKEFQKDLDSGRQGTMTSFFTAKLKSKPKSKEVQAPEKSSTKPKAIPAAQAMLSLAGASRKSQKQSLILIEEADVLFEEDQNFWAHIIKLAAQSKRPIVVTCNDELQIPTQALPIAAILRLSPPPVDLASDYLIALAGKEGHILQRQAIVDLYESRHYDFRASIMELNFWCQMSVGDKKGGLEWMYQRWPPSRDVDVHGRLLRVASEGTYQSGMGWLSHNVFETKNNAVFDQEEELLLEVWNGWGINPASWGAVDRPSNKLARTDDNARFGQLNELDRLVTFSDALSASDVSFRVDLPSYDNMHDQPIDPTLPPITDKERLSYTIDAPLLQADEQPDFLGLDTALSTQISILTHRMFPDLAHRPKGPSPTACETREQNYTDQILRHKAESDDYKSPLPRSAFASAFDILATLPSPFNTFEIDHRSSYNLIASSFDRPFSLVTLDLAPYIRSIVAHEQVLEAQRIRLGNLLSEGGSGKRVRITRVSRTAMEGGERKTKRRERWFHKDLSFELVMDTAGRTWAGLGWRDEGEEEGDEESMTDAGTV